ncbi:hypothetical protein AVEN_172771-1 [Araneus ventricosus]|uniref:Uncharacterized protein n=1 Tax=Araneus ventricosus TaxID=182803 RepID=A0A4Y2BHY1_ARAVE|nr:hypothetical protein AVEN_172771-1 [Araneus ventricosus]
MDEKFEMLLAMMKEMKSGLENKMEVGQEEMRSGQERLEQEMRSRSGQEEQFLTTHPVVTIENSLESRFGDSHFTQFYRTENKTTKAKRKPSSFSADVERLMSLAYAECPLNVRESLAVQFFVDAIRDKETQLSTRLMDFMYLKSALKYSMEFESVKTASKIPLHAR